MAMAPTREPSATGIRTGTAARIPENALPAESPGGDAILDHDSNAIGAVGERAGQAQQHQEGNREHGSAACQRVDDSGEETPGDQDRSIERTHGGSESTLPVSRFPHGAFVARGSLSGFELHESLRVGGHHVERTAPYGSWSSPLHADLVSRAAPACRSPAWTASSSTGWRGDPVRAGGRWCVAPEVREAPRTSRRSRRTFEPWCTSTAVASS